MKGGARSFGNWWNANGRRQNRETPKAERTGSAFFSYYRARSVTQRKIGQDRQDKQEQSSAFPTPFSFSSLRGGDPTGPEAGN
jgi:hypothetical protein